MLPRAHPQHNLMTRPTPPNPRIQRAGCGPKAARARLHATPHLGQAVAVLGVHVDVLAAIVRAWQRRSCDISAEDGEERIVGWIVFARGVGFDEPDETGAEHGCGGREEGFFERGRGGEGRADF